MNCLKNKRDYKSKNENKLSKLIKSKSHSEDEDSEHELSYYIKDRVRLMKEILKIIKPKKLKSMAPDCMKKMDMEEVNSLLLEELLGISSKRLKYIFEGKTFDEDSSSSDEDVKPDIDVISLDDISDDDFVIDLDSDAESSSKKQHKRCRTSKSKHEPKKKLKKEKPDKEKSKSQKSKEKEKTGEENLMSVLELLELQARARAIKSQLALENSKKAAEQSEKEKSSAIQDEDEEDAVIAVETSDKIEIIITSESENEESKEITEEQQNYSVNDHEETNNKDEEQSEEKENHKDIVNNKRSIEVSSNNTSKKKHLEKDQTALETGNIPLPEENVQESNDSSRTQDNSVEPEKQDENRADSSNSDNENLNVIKLRLLDKQEQVSIAATQEIEGSGDNSNSRKAEESPETLKTVESVSKLDQCVQNVIEELSLNNKSNETTENSSQTEEKTKRKSKISKEKRMINLKNRLKSYKNEVETEPKIKIIENVVVSGSTKSKVNESQMSVHDGDEIIINVDQDEFDCIICD